MLQIQYDDLETIALLPVNAKRHSNSAIKASLARWGVLEQIIINDETGHVISGNGRIETLRAMKANGEAAPAEVQVDGDHWRVPVVHGFRAEVEREAAVALAANRAHDLGGYREADLEDVLADLRTAGQLDGTGYTPEDVEFLTRNVGPLDTRFGDTGDDNDEDAADGSPLASTDLSDRIIILFDDETDVNAFWQRVGWQPEVPGVTYRWTAIESRTEAAHAN